LIRVKDYECGRCKGFHNNEEDVKYVKLGNDVIEVSKNFATLEMFLPELVVMFNQSSVMARIPVHAGW